MKYLKRFNESIDTLVMEIDENKYKSFTHPTFAPTQREKMSAKTINLIKSQITKIERFLYGKSFNNLPEIQISIFNNTLTYNRDFDLGRSELRDLFIKVFEIEDSWFIIDMYSVWNHHYFQCDDTLGLEKFSEIAIETINRDLH